MKAAHMTKAGLLVFVTALFINPKIGMAQDLTSGLVAYFPFTGSPNDSGPNSLVTTINGSVTLTSDRKDAEDKAYLFDVNQKSYIKIDQNTALNLGSGSMTISAWFNLNSSTFSNMSIFNNASNYTMGIWFGIDMNSTNNFGLLVGGGGATAIADSSIGINILDQPENFRTGWHHALALVDREKNVARLYLDGAQMPIAKYTKYGMPAGTITGNDLDITGLPLKMNPYTTSAIGAYVNGTTVINRFDGAMDELRIYNRALTAAEIGMVSGKTSVGIAKAPRGSKAWNISQDPAGGTLMIEAGRGGRVEIFNHSGKLVYRSNADAPRMRIDISGYSGGIYFVKVSDGEDIHSRKIIIR